MGAVLRLPPPSRQLQVVDRLIFHVISIDPCRQQPHISTRLDKSQWTDLFFLFQSSWTVIQIKYNSVIEGKFHFKINLLE
jgi:hypothetical protein